GSSQQRSEAIRRTRHFAFSRNVESFERGPTYRSQHPTTKSKVSDMDEKDLRLTDGRTLHVYDSALGDDARLPVVWHHGTPNLGFPPEPLFEAGEWLGIRWIGFDRPGYGGSTADPGRTVASVTADLTTVLDSLGVGTFALMGYSGGGTFALGAAAILGSR